MRDIEKRDAYTQPNPKLLVFVENNDNYLIKASSTFPIKTSGVTISLIDSTGVGLKGFDYLITGTRTVTDGCFPFKEVNFSFRVPKDGNDYYLVITDKDDEGAQGIFVLDQQASGVYASQAKDVSFSADTDSDYGAWLRVHQVTLKSLDTQEKMVFSYTPLISLVVPLFNTPVTCLRELVASVLKQSYPHWELILVNATPSNTDLIACIKAFADRRIKVVPLEKNLGIAGNTVEGCKVASGDFIGFVDHDDTVEPDMLFQYVTAINDEPAVDLLYCDEDHLDEDGQYFNPHFKPDFNIDLLRSYNYITHLLMLRRTFLEDIGYPRSEYDGAQDYDLVLRASEHTSHIVHIPRVLYHWRASEGSTSTNSASKPYANETGRRALQAHLDRLHLKATAADTERSFIYRVTYTLEEDSLISIVIPNKDESEMLKVCIASIEDNSTYDNYEIVVVENNSTEDETFACYEMLQAQYQNVHVVMWDKEFNFSKIMNFGVDQAKGEYVLLLNNDTEVITPSFLEEMLGYCQREDVGIVGAKLLYPDGSVQHAGVGAGICAGAGHLAKFLDRENPGYYLRAAVPQDLSAVTAACMMTKKAVYEEVGGFSEDFPVAFNDVDYCLKVRDTGRLVVMDPYAVLYHYESVSRGLDDDKVSIDKQIRFHKEVALLNYRWAKYFVVGDPYLSPNFNRGTLNYTL